MDGRGGGREEGRVPRLALCKRGMKKGRKEGGKEKGRKEGMKEGGEEHAMKVLIPCGFHPFLRMKCIAPRRAFSTGTLKTFRGNTHCCNRHTFAFYLSRKEGGKGGCLGWHFVREE